MKKRVWLSQVTITDFEVEVDDTPENNKWLQESYKLSLEAQTLGVERAKVLRRLTGLQKK